MSAFGRRVNPEDSKAKMIEVMGIDLGELMFFFEKELNILNIRLREYQLLYGKMDHIKLLTESAGFFFADYQVIFIEHFVLSVMRLVEQPKKRGVGKKLTFQSLPSLIDDSHPELQSKIRQKLSKLIKAVKSLKDARDNYIAHYNYQKKVIAGVDDLRNLGLSDFEGIMKNMMNIHQEIISDYLDYENRYDLTQVKGGVSELLDCLEASEEHFKNEDLKFKELYGPNNKGS